MSVQENINEGKYINNVPYSPETPQAYRTRESEIINKFWSDVEIEFDAGQYNRAKWNKMISLAWSQGHSSGLSEVLYWVEELVELL